MRLPAKRAAMLGLATLAILAAILILVFSSGGAGQHRNAGAGPAGQSDVQVAAGYLGISAVALRRQLRSGLTLAEVADAGTGTSSAGLLHALLKARTAAMTSRGLTAGAERERLAATTRRLQRELQRSRRGPGRALTLAARYLGIDADALLSRLASGKSLSELASATAGKSRTGLIEALTEPREQRLRAAAASHRLTAASANAAIVALRARAIREVDLKGEPGQR